MQIWVCTDAAGFAEVPAAEAEPLLELVPEMHRERILRYRRDCDRVRSALCWVLLRMGLQKEYGMELPEVERRENGKLFFTEENGLYFNFSHCTYGVCCAIGTGNLGADIQDIRPVSENVIRRCCSEREQEQLANAADRDRLFAQLWSRKEAMGKAIGSGIAENLKELGWADGQERTQQYFCFDTMIDDQMALAVCSEEQMTDVWKEICVFSSLGKILSEFCKK